MQPWMESRPNRRETRCVGMRSESPGQSVAIHLFPISLSFFLSFSVPVSDVWFRDDDRRRLHFAHLHSMKGDKGEDVVVDAGCPFCIALICKQRPFRATTWRRKCSLLPVRLLLSLWLASWNKERQENERTGNDNMKKKFNGFRKWARVPPPLPPLSFPVVRSPLGAFKCLQRASSDGHRWIGDDVTTRKTLVLLF